MSGDCPGCKRTYSRLHQHLESSQVCSAVWHGMDAASNLSSAGVRAVGSTLTSAGGNDEPSPVKSPQPPFLHNRPLELNHPPANFNVSSPCHPYNGDFTAAVDAAGGVPQDLFWDTDDDADCIPRISATQLGRKQASRSRHVRQPKLGTLLGEGGGACSLTRQYCNNVSDAGGRTVPLSEVSDKVHTASPDFAPVVPTHGNAAAARRAAAAESVSSNDSSCSDVAFPTGTEHWGNRPGVPKEVRVNEEDAIEGFPVSLPYTALPYEDDASASDPARAPCYPSGMEVDVDHEDLRSTDQTNIPSSDPGMSALPTEEGVPEGREDRWESKVNLGYYQRHPYFFFRLELTRMLHQMKPPPPRNFIDNLLTLMTDHGVGSSIKWQTQDHYTQEYFLNYLRKLSGRETLPTVTQVALESSTYRTKNQYDQRNPHRDVASVIHWAPSDQIGSLLTGSQFMSQLDNLVVDQEEPFGMYRPEPGDKYGEFLTGDWYPPSYNRMVRYHDQRTDIVGEKLRPFLCPLVFGCDATGTDAYQRLKMEPLMVTLAIFKRKIRNLPDVAWRPCAYLPALDNKSKNARLRERQGDRLSRATKDGLNTRNYHHCLSPFFSDLAKLQKRGLVITLSLGDKTETVHCYFPIVSIIGDIKSQDMFAGRVMSHARNLPRMFFQCSCPFDDMDNEDVECTTFSLAEYHHMVRGCEKITIYDPDSGRFYGGEASVQQQQVFLDNYDAGGEESQPTTPENNPIMDLDSFEYYLKFLRSKGCLRVDSCLNDLDYGESSTGQFSALGLDLLHSLLGGVVKRLVVTFLLGLPSRQKELFEEIADRVFLGQRSSEKKYLPRMNFTHGCVNLTELTCREWVGLMMAVLVVCQSYSGGALLEKLVQRTAAQAKKHREEVRKQTRKKRGKKTRKRRRVSGDVSDDSGYGGDGDGEVGGGGMSDDDSDVAAMVRDRVLEGDMEEGTTDVTSSAFVQIAESMLAFVGYLNQDEFWEIGDRDSQKWFRDSCNLLLREMKRCCPRYVGNGWKLAKVHAIFIRMEGQIAARGTPKNTNTEVVEGGLPKWAKAPAQNTNRQSHLAVAKRAALNLDETIMVNYAFDKFTEQAGDLSGFAVGDSNAPMEAICPGRKCEWLDPPQTPGTVPPLSQNPSYHVGFFLPKPKRKLVKKGNKRNQGNSPRRSSWLGRI